MNIFICGQRSFGRAVLKALHEAGHKIVGVAPPPQDKYYDKMHGLAVKLGINVVNDCDKLVSTDIPENTDLIVAAHSHWYISDKIIEKTTYGGIGFHPSLLPRHRGQDAVRWVIEMGETVTGATVFYLNDKVDGGDIINQQHIFINKQWNYKDLWRVIFPIGVELICKSVEEIGNGTAKRIAQDEQFATWQPSWNRGRLKRNELIMIE